MTDHILNNAMRSCDHSGSAFGRPRHNIYQPPGLLTRILNRIFG